MAFITTTEPLTASSTYTSQVVLSDRQDNIVGSVFSDQAGELYVEQSGDGDHWDISTKITVTADAGQGFSETLYCPFIRIRYVNGASNQGEFRIFARLSSAGDS